MRRYYENATYNAAFERCIDIMTRMIQQYGGKVLERQQNQAPKKDDIALKKIITPKIQKLHKN